MTITLPADPSEVQYEDFVAALLLAGGYFIEPRLKFRDNGVELLELDVVATPANEKYLDRILVEAKSGGWGFADFFKVFGWVTFLRLGGGFLIHKTPSDERKKEMLDRLKPDTRIECCEVSQAKLFEGAIPICNTLEPVERKVLLATAWYALIGQRLALGKLIHRYKSSPTPGLEGALKYQRACERSFFNRTALERVHSLCEAYHENPKLTGQFVGEIAAKTKQETKKILYQLTGEDYEQWLQYVMLLEHKARVAIIKNSLDHLLDPNAKDEVALTFLGTTFRWTDLNLPPGCCEGLKAVRDHKYTRKLPYLFQLFIEVYGGFYAPKKENELKLLSNATGIPEAEIPDCLKLYDVFFPFKEGWFYTIKDELVALKMVPALARGAGCFVRQYAFGLKSYAERYSASVPLGHWHNAFLSILHPELQKKAGN